jgi:ribosomal protein L29
MKKNALKDLKLKSIGELEKEVKSRQEKEWLQKEKHLRREIAQILTLIKEKKIMEKEVSQK